MIPPFDNGLKVTPEVLERKRVLMAGSINMTDAMTASGLAKKYFFNAHYDGGKRPIYTLLPEEDRYIRDSYFGGRVELSFLGVVYGRGGHCTYNVDTDSVTTNLDLSKHPDLLNEFIPAMFSFDQYAAMHGPNPEPLKCKPVLRMHANSLKPGNMFTWTTAQS